MSHKLALCEGPKSEKAATLRTGFRSLHWKAFTGCRCCYDVAGRCLLCCHQAVCIVGVDRRTFRNGGTTLVPSCSDACMRCNVHLCAACSSNPKQNFRVLHWPIPTKLSKGRCLYIRKLQRKVTVPRYQRHDEGRPIKTLS